MILVKSKFLIEILFNAFVNLKRGDREGGGGEKGGVSFFSKFSFNFFYVIMQRVPLFTIFRGNTM